LWLLACVAVLAGCDQMKERVGFPDPARVEAEGKAIGGGCRHAGRGLEDCYRLNPEAPKSAIYAGWKEMHEYMARNNIAAVAPSMPTDALTSPESAPKKKAKQADAEVGDAPAEKGAEKDADVPAKKALSH